MEEEEEEDNEEEEDEEGERHSASTKGTTNAVENHWNYREPRNKNAKKARYQRSWSNKQA